MMFLDQKKYKKHCILLNTTLEIPSFPTKETPEQTAAFEYYK